MSTIIRVAARGEGVTADGRHVPFAAPGDRLRDDGAIEHGAHHQTPPCRHFPECGGCQLQHLDDAAWSQFIVDRIAGALAGQGLSADIRAPILSPPRTRRRAALHAEPSGRVGFAVEKSHAIVDLAECHVLAPELFALVAPLRRLVHVLRPRRRLNLHLTLADQGVDLLVNGIMPEGLAAAEAITAFAQANRLARVAFDEGYGPEVRWEPEGVTITLGGVPVPLPPASFLQATREGEAALVSAVRSAVGEAPVVADLFAGLGTFALALPGRVYAAEAGREAIMALKAAASRSQRPVFTEHRDLYRRPLTPAELDRFAAIVIDPPRAGAKEQAQALALSRVPRVAYVSCNPSSFARDVKTMVEGGWQVDWIQPVGQFRWSTHVELAASLSRGD
ncbi:MULTISPECIES: class I SAM-dependent RNA methyltransferase [unclassified Sphingomonas]|uniref:class I SAM-dependent RNA methyltransferase n=1 Tax=unclassified Sphingomonas TaxID=196159 RepID=UPI001D0FE615|nr:MULTISPECIES: class I SAM-dependent RNA methyltransferase [unclassified Sphingomonas]MCC2979536.1 class I SAM-dependent RNA methyltransferase [Sphingomonas sp. IC4-52]MCD2315235.1 class I SAM-dependent RNA methyltransferase [Sphingomonas sp. IC-11]